jgi:predicted AlkP superfamily pyrophosphatase or phosphodiesterase
MKSETKPQHATMLTGFLADVHGVFTNKHYQLIPDGLTVYEEIEGLDSDIKTAHISGKKKHFGERTFGNVVEDVDFFTAEKMSPVKGANIAMSLIRQWSDSDFFIVCHFNQPDRSGHKYGVDSDRYEKMILVCDHQLGRILNELDRQDILDETAVYVLSDHGFGNPKPTSHPKAPNTFIISSEVGIGDMFMVDVAGFLLSHFGL